MNEKSFEKKSETRNAMQEPMEEDDSETDSPCDPNTIFLSYHPHELHKVNPMSIYKEYGGNWKCDNCGKESGPLHYPYHCKACSYDICKKCSQGVRLDAHEHPLFYTNTSRLFHQSDNGVWKCATCSRSSSETGQTHSLHCSLCDFDLCLECATPRQYLIHCHPLATVKTSIVYPSTGGNWACDFCGRTSRPNERFCGGWRCDNCGSLHNTPDDNKPWHCLQCEHDLCDACMHRLNNGIYNFGDDPGPPPRALTREQVMRNPHLALNHSISEPKEPMVSAKAVEHTEKPPEAVEEGDECIICTERPKNATIIHGDTGHLCCCWQCAQVVKMRGDPCPICRMPIDKVIRQYKA
ncbi:uncharacterized protein LOC116302283 isoform X2 [Actinia tenebrosa]|uniref:Uncharacterized protein LOC116302283 isoform X2 n=1 Tax=Actinia tenebrosa TaxID=6105 RepID=A0A6P8ILW6_ACTTE|nr:uncharacterized protein LOC116302283 isoform X2 [Actinia tenebrosa]